MSKIIRLTPEDIAQYTKEFTESLISTKCPDGKISYSKILGAFNRKAKIFFSDLAWIKMTSLVREFANEVAWHGVATRGSDETKDEYYITDILVYPQEVSDATVDMDTTKYANWLMENAEDERFYSIAMQGHSHVNMGVTPSGTDLKHQGDILDQLTDDMFYIFMIYNKKGEKNIKIYDLKKNVLFETSDIEVGIIDGVYGLDSFIKDAKKMVTERRYAGCQYYQSPSKNTSTNDVPSTVPKTNTTSVKNTAQESKSNTDDKNNTTKTSSPAPISTQTVQKTDKKRKGRRKKDKQTTKVDIPYGDLRPPYYEDYQYYD